MATTKMVAIIFLLFCVIRTFMRTTNGRPYNWLHINFRYNILNLSRQGHHNSEFRIKILSYAIADFRSVQSECEARKRELGAASRCCRGNSLSERAITDHAVQRECEARKRESGAPLVPYNICALSSSAESLER